MLAVKASLLLASESEAVILNGLPVGAFSTSRQNGESAGVKHAFIETAAPNALHRRRKC